jgi:hypothetical protein
VCRVRISAFLKRVEYVNTVEELSAEIGDDLDDAKFTLESVEEKSVPVLVKLECEATSVLLQVLYTLHRGHVQFLMADYKSRIIEEYPNAFARVRPPKLGKDGQPLKIANIGVTDSSSDNLVDMTGNDPEEGETSDIEHNDGGESEANTFASSTSEKELRPPNKRSTAPSKSIEAAGFGSDTSPRSETGDNDELDQVEDNKVHIVQRAARLFRTA